MGYSGPVVGRSSLHPPWETLDNSVRLVCRHVRVSEGDRLPRSNLVHTKKVYFEKNTIPLIKCKNLRLGLVAPPAFFGYGRLRHSTSKAYFRMVVILKILQDDIASEFSHDLTGFEGESLGFRAMTTASASCRNDNDEHKK